MPKPTFPSPRSSTPRVQAPPGPVTVRQIAALYLYDNELYAIQGDGRMVKDALENAARYFLTCPDAACSHGPLIDPKVAGFHYDMAEGVEYEIDLTRPPGDRVRNLRRNGKPLDPGEKLRIAVNNYRAGGSGGYEMFRGAKILWRSSQEIRDLNRRLLHRASEVTDHPVRQLAHPAACRPGNPDTGSAALMRPASGIGKLAWLE